LLELVVGVGGRENLATLGEILASLNNRFGLEFGIGKLDEGTELGFEDAGTNLDFAPCEGPVLVVIGDIC
jgi:hypothetical protein